LRPLRQGCAAPEGSRGGAASASLGDLKRACPPPRRRSLPPRRGRG
jgi:hypothetical protein